MKRIRWLVWVPAFVAGVPLLGLGVPVVWLWIASRLQHTTEGIGLLPAIALTLGMPLTYLALTVLAHRVSGRETAPARRHRDAWTRSLSAERQRTSAATTPVEGVFIATVVVVGVFSEIYLLFFASPSVSLGP